MKLNNYKYFIQHLVIQVCHHLIQRFESNLTTKQKRFFLNRNLVVLQVIFAFTKSKIESIFTGPRKFLNFAEKRTSLTEFRFNLTKLLMA